MIEMLVIYLLKLCIFELYKINRFVKKKASMNTLKVQLLITFLCLGMFPSLFNQYLYMWSNINMNDPN